MAFALDPSTLRPMLAVRGAMPHGDEWRYEIKWDGFRILAFVDGADVRFVTRNGIDRTNSFPTVGSPPKELTTHRAIFDGEIVALDEHGQPNFGLLQQRGKAASQLIYVVFDVLELDGVVLLDEPLERRQQILERLGFEGKVWQRSLVSDDGEALLAFTKEQRLEGVMAKRLDGTYRPGQRNPGWLKIKNSLGQEVVIGGWTYGEGARGGSLGALLVGYYEADGTTLRYAGRVGTGFSSATLADLQKRLAGLRRKTSPFADTVKEADTVFVKPKLVAEVEFTEWTGAGIMRHPSFKGLRTDKDPTEVRRES